MRHIECPFIVTTRGDEVTVYGPTHFVDALGTIDSPHETSEAKIYVGRDGAVRLLE